MVQKSYGSGSLIVSDRLQLLDFSVTSFNFKAEPSYGGLSSSVLFQPQTLIHLKQHTPTEHHSRGWLLVNYWSGFGQFRSRLTTLKIYGNRPKHSLDVDRASPPTKREGSVAEIKVPSLSVAASHDAKL